MRAKGFEEIKVLGDGAYGVVSKCRHVESGDLVAVKRMKQRVTSYKDCLELKEVKSLRNFRHPNVVQLRQMFVHEEHLHLVFELLGESLLKTIQKRTEPFNEDEVRNIIQQILVGLDAVHSHGFFHRDMKPENLLWGGSTLKICDFGLAKEIRSLPPFTEYISTRWYRAPELALLSDRYNSPVDIWAVGAIMIELYTLRPAFQGNSQVDQLFKIFAVTGSPTMDNWPEGVSLLNHFSVKPNPTSPTPLSVIVPGASPEALDLLSGLLQLNPARRLNAKHALAHPFFAGTPSPRRNLSSHNSSRSTSSASTPRTPRTSPGPPMSISRPQPTGVTPSFDDIFEGIM